MFDEQISPELALVCPELRAKAIAALPQEPPFASRPQRSEAPLVRAHPGERDQAGRRRHEGRTMARDAGAYVLVRATGLLAILGGALLLVLILAGIASVLRG